MLGGEDEPSVPSPALVRTGNARPSASTAVAAKTDDRVAVFVAEDHGRVAVFAGQRLQAVEAAADAIHRARRAAKVNVCW